MLICQWERRNSFHIIKKEYDNMEPKKLSAIDITAIIIASTTVLINIISYFFLPDTIITQIFSSNGNRLSTLFYLIIIAVMISVSAAMTVFYETKTKWIFITSVLAVFNIVFITLNLIWAN